MIEPPSAQHYRRVDPSRPFGTCGAAQARAAQSSKVRHHPPPMRKIMNLLAFGDVAGALDKCPAAQGSAAQD